MGDTVSINTKGLDQLVKALKDKKSSLKVGVLGDAGARASGGASGGPSNAQVAAWHEFGTTFLPVRSFLRVPLSDLLAKRLEQAGAFDKVAMTAVVRSGTLVPWLEKIGAVAVDIVIGAFDSQGYGKWPGWKNPKYENNTGQVLVDTQQLRNSISSEVKS